MGDYFDKLVLDIHSSLNNINIYVNRKKEYNNKGRVQNENESLEIDKKIKNMLYENNIEYYEYDGIYENINKIFEKIKNAL